MRNTKNLKKILSNHFIKFSLIPIFVVEIAGIILYFSINSFVSSNNSEFLLKEAQFHSQSILKDEAVMINDKLVEISRMASILQDAHENIMSNPEQFQLSNFNVNFGIASNGVFYKTSEIGSSLYYSSETKITDIERKKAIITEAMDTSLKSVVDTNPYIGAAYFNTWDNMNRLYPFIDKVYDQYGKHIQMEDYNFYYLADKKHNPEKKPVWTSAYLDPAGNGWMMSCVVPIYNNDFLEGVTGLDITIDNFVNNILNKKLSYDANLFMIDKDGMIIAMPEKIESLLGLKELKEHLYTDSILKTISKPEEYNVLTNKSPFAAHFKNLIENKGDYSVLKIKDKEYLTLQQNIDETNWKLIILIDKDNIYSSIENLKSLSDKVGYIAIIFLVFFYVLFFTFLLRRINVFSNSITEPIIDLSKQTSEISIKNTDVKVINTDILEIHQLSSNFVSMINELNERSKKLHEAKRNAIEANKIKSDFLSNMSHELRTPLNGVIGMSQIALDNEKNKEQRKYLERINSSGTILLNIINDLLDYSKIEAGKLSIENIEFKIDAVLQSVADLVAIKAYEKDLEVIFNRDLSIPKRIIGDSLRTIQMLVNIISNAIKFTEKGEIVVEIKAKEIKEKEIILEFSIKDTGIGMNEETLNNIFNSFTQADNTISRKYGGTGLGLSITKSLITLMGGDINVSSKENVGTTFFLNIPFGYVNNEEDNIDYSLTNNIEIKLFDISHSIEQYIKDILDLFKIKYEVISNFDFFIKKEIKYIILTENKNPISDFTTLLITSPNNVLINSSENIKIITKPITPSIIYDSIIELIDVNTKLMNQLSIEQIKKCQGVNVLLVEDNPTNQIIAKLFLESFGCTVKILDNGLEAVNFFRNKNTTDIVFMDIQMPIMNGYDATNIIRNELKLDLPIIAMTANTMVEDIKKVGEIGMNRHIGKPINKKEIEAAIIDLVLLKA